MRKIALLAAVAGAAAFGSAAHADFIYQIASGGMVPAGQPDSGDAIYNLQIEAVTGTLQSNNVTAYTVSMTSTTASPSFIIRTWNKAGGYWDDGATPQGGVNPDVNNLGTLESDLATNRPGTAASFVRLGGTTAYLYASSNPDHGATGFTDYQGIPSLSVDSGTQPGSPVVVPTTKFVTMASAVVPVGQEVTFSGNTISDLPADVKGLSFSVSVNNTPEPASFCAFGLGAAGLLARRRRA
jgi:PEP-CTERM motif-containing protein